MMHDYEAEIAEYWPTIMEAWHAHAAKRPMIECDLANKKVYAYDSAEYIAHLSERTRETTRRKFARAMAEGCIMVFVKDSTNCVLQSYIFRADNGAVEMKPNHVSRRRAKVAARPLRRHVGVGGGD